MVEMLWIYTTISNLTYVLLYSSALSICVIFYLSKNICVIFYKFIVPGNEEMQFPIFKN